ncbi:MAG: AsmA family protein [Proteobacteria bacterium]|nr:AsmA family protein [Pseudomonadota bacterium]
MNRKYIYLTLGAFAAVIAALVVAIHLLVPTDALRGQIEQTVSRATGRDFRIHGALSLALFPSVGLDAHDVTLANRPGGVAPDMLRVSRMRIGVRLWPLFSGKIEADAITLDQPVIALEVARDGSANWELKPEPGKPTGGPHIPSEASFSGLSVSGARITYDNAKLGVHRALSDLDAEVDISKIDAPTSAKGGFTFQGRHLEYTVTATTPKSLLDGRATKVDVALNADFLHAGFIGFVSSDGTLKGQGSLRTNSLKDVAGWLGHPVSAGQGLGALTALASIAAKDRRIVLSGIQAKLDGMAIDGNLTVDTHGDVPAVSGTLHADRLDLNRYMSVAAKPGAAKTGGPPQGGWSKAPIKLDFLKLIDGQLIINAGGLSVMHLKTGATTIALTLDKGKMHALLSPMALYGGTGKAELTVDAGGATPVVANSLTFSKIAIRPFLEDTIGIDRIEGTGTIILNVTSKGGSPDAVMRALSGKGSVAIVKGNIRGVDLGMVARTVTNILSAGATGQNAATAFDRFGGSFSISNGMLWNGDLKLESAFLHMKGAGHLDLGNQTINYRIEPTASLGGSKLHLLDVGVPFAITGPWSHVSYKPDLAGAVTGIVGSAIETGTAPITGLFNGLTGGDKPKPKKKGKTSGDTLKDLFGLH